MAVLKHSWLSLLCFKGMTLLMMGSADALPEEPVARPVFVEDMTEEQLASAVSAFPTSVSCKPPSSGKFLNTCTCLKLDFETGMSV